MIHSGSFKKGHGRLRTDESYAKASIKISKALKGHPQFNTGRTHFKKGVSNNVKENNPMWKGGKYKMHSGYIYLKVYDHPYARKDHYIAEHRLVMENKIGRYLKPTEAVHHINGIKNDNRPENLELMTTFLHYGKMECPYCNKQFLVR